MRHAPSRSIPIDNEGGRKNRRRSSEGHAPAAQAATPFCWSSPRMQPSVLIVTTSEVSKRTP